MKCPNCFKETDSNKFCIYCGTSLENSTKSQLHPVSVLSKSASSPQETANIKTEFLKTDVTPEDSFDNTSTAPNLSPFSASNIFSTEDISPDFSDKKEKRKGLFIILYVAVISLSITVGSLLGLVSAKKNLPLLPWQKTETTEVFHWNAPQDAIRTTVDNTATETE